MKDNLPNKSKKIRFNSISDESRIFQMMTSHSKLRTGNQKITVRDKRTDTDKSSDMRFFKTSDTDKNSDIRFFETSDTDKREGKREN